MPPGFPPPIPPSPFFPSSQDPGRRPRAHLRGRRTRHLGLLTLRSLLSRHRQSLPPHVPHRLRTLQSSARPARHRTLHLRHTLLLLHRLLLTPRPRRHLPRPRPLRRLSSCRYKITFGVSDAFHCLLGAIGKLFSLPYRGNRQIHTYPPYQYHH